MGTNWKAVERLLKLVIVVGLAFFLTIIPSSNAGHLATSPATFSIITNPTVIDGVAIRGQTARNATGSADAPMGVVGAATGHATGQDSAIVAVRGNTTGNATGPLSAILGVQGRVTGDATGAESALLGVQGRVIGNATGLNSLLVGVQGRVTAVDPAGFTGQNAIAWGVQGRVDGIPGPTAQVVGVRGRASATSGNAQGVSGQSDSTSGVGVFGIAAATSGATFGVQGQASSPDGVGVRGFTTATSGSNYGVFGSSVSPDGVGVFATGNRFALLAIANGPGAYAIRASTTAVPGNAIVADAETRGVWGVAHASLDGAAGVVGEARGGSGDTRGVWGLSHSANGNGVFGESGSGGNGVYGFVHTAANGVAVIGEALAPATRAGLFIGRVDINCNNRAAGCLFVDSHRVGDLAEDLPSLGKVSPGDVVVLASTPKKGYGVTPASRAYDIRVAGIVSDEPRIHFRVRQDKPMAAVAMVGVVRANATTVNGPIEFGNLLTTSSVPGHLMRCPAPVRCIGAIVGKALEPLPKGKTQILVLLWRQ